MPEPLPKLDEITQLSPLVVRVLGLNPGEYSLQGTNTYLVGSGPSRILVDAGENARGYLPLLERAMKQHGVSHISDVLITHYHHDHSEGLLGLRRRFGTALRAWKMDPTYRGVAAHGPSFSLASSSVQPLVDGQVLTTEDGSASLRVLATPGHTPDHCCLLLLEEGALFAGDCVLGGSSTVFEDLHTYLASLSKMLGALEAEEAAVTPRGATQRRRLYPGHGEVLDEGASAIRENIDHRLKRERQVLGVLAARAHGLTPLGIVREVYPRLSESLRLAAAHNVRMHLLKLRIDGRAEPWFGGEAAESTTTLRRKRMPFEWLLLERWTLVSPEPEAQQQQTAVLAS